MEQNTVLLSVDKYNELRDFRKNIESGKTLVIKSGWNYYNQRFITTDEAIEEIAKANQLLQKENDELQKENQPKEKSLSDIKRMSIWQFIKWRNS